MSVMDLLERHRYKLFLYNTHCNVILQILGALTFRLQVITERSV